MNARVLLACSLLFIGLSGCGDQDVFIAEKVKFKTSLSKNLYQVSFVIQPEYQIEASKQISYEKLGEVFLLWNEKIKQNEIGSLISGDPRILERDYPILDFSRFPNGERLPQSVREGSLREWPIQDSHLSISFLYAGAPDLVGGGRITSSQFSSLPKNFLAIQNFKFKNGDTKASVGVAGPTDHDQGGVFFIANFGLLPKTDSSHETRLLEENSADDFEILANEPAEIINRGSFWPRIWPDSISNLKSGFTTDLLNLPSSSLTEIQ